MVEISELESIEKKLKFCKIKRICSNAFEIRVELEKDSKLQSHGKQSSSKSSIEEITISKNIEIIKKESFCFSSLVIFLIEKGSISKSLFEGCFVLEKIKIPKISSIATIEKTHSILLC